jgi:predicted phosphodiesterase
MKLSEYLRKYSSIKDFNVKNVALKFNTTQNTVRNTWFLIQKKRKLSPQSEIPEELLIDAKDDGTHLSSKSATIKTLDDLIRVANIDLTKNKIIRHIINKWEMGSKEQWQVKAWLTPITSQDVLSTEFLKDALIGAIEDRLTTIPKKLPTYFGNMLEISIPDLHLGKYSIFDETGQVYNKEIAQQRYLASIEALLDKASSFKLDKIVLVIGNDFLNSDGLSKGTTKGTPQDNDMRYTEMFKVGVELIIKAVDLCSKVTEDIDIIAISGNHDEQAMYYLGIALDAFFTFNTNVGVDSSASMRKYFQWGRTLFGFTHGDSEKHDKLPLIMATEEPQKWADTFFHEWHIGHFHKNKTDEYNGCQVITIPSLSGPDYWHYKNGYVGGKPQAIGSVYNREKGCVAKLIHTCF